VIPSRFDDDDTDVRAAPWLAASREVHGFLGETGLRRQTLLVAQPCLPGAET